MTKTKTPFQRAINEWLIREKCGQYVTQVRWNSKKRAYRAFLCTWWEGSNMLQFRMIDNQEFYVEYFSTEDGVEKSIAISKAVKWSGSGYVITLEG